MSFFSSPDRVPKLLVALAFLAFSGCLPKAKIHQRAIDEVYKAYDYMRVDDLERAEISFKHALQFNDDFPEAWNGLGLIEMRRNNLEAAKQYFEKAVRINNDFAEGHNNLGRVLLAQGRVSAAEDQFAASLKINPDFIDARYNLAVTLLTQGYAHPKRRKEYWAQSRREYLHLLTAKPDAAEAYHALGFMEYEKANFREAEKNYRRAVELAPTYMEALHGLCISLVQLNRCDEAVSYCQRCLHVSPNLPECKKSLEGARTCSTGELGTPRGRPETPLEESE